MTEQQSHPIGAIPMMTDQELAEKYAGQCYRGYIDSCVDTTRNNFDLRTEIEAVCLSVLSASCEANRKEIERLQDALRSVAIYDQDERPLGTDQSPFDWRRRSMKQEDIARAALTTPKEATR